MSASPCSRAGDKLLDARQFIATTSLDIGEGRGDLMRLVCPNCDAQYEVPEDAIPEGGRDVQCSSCGHAWFQLRAAPQVEPEEAPAEPAIEAEADRAETADAPLPEEAPDAEPERVAEPDTLPEPPPEAPAPAMDAEAKAVAALIADEADTQTAPPPPIPAPLPDPETEPDEPDDVVPAKPQLDDAVLSILREEAEREADARRQESQKAENRRAEAEGQMQTQPDLGVEAAGAAMTVAQRRLAMIKGEDPESPVPPAARPAARRDLLPDVEEINSTLQPGDAAIDPDAEVDALPDLTRSGFRSGFFLMLFLALAAAAAYVMAPRLAEAIPGLEGMLTAYVSFVDGLRLGLDRLMESATHMLKGGEG
ncbi:hypothetical protein B6K69_09675 [Fuscovulum blasticum]|nr:hypothetical protein B6K69_09675 [Fuscovulum blasticum]